MSNMELWRSVQRTDPKYTKEVGQRGGYHAIGGQYQLMMATEQWGPYGSEWGLRDLQYSYEEDATGAKCIALEAYFFWPGGQFPISVDMVFKANDDCRKKLLTSARSKALSYLGFNADVFLGKFDDNHYVSEAETYYGEKAALRKNALIKIRLAQTDESLALCRQRVEGLLSEDAIGSELCEELLKAIDDREQELHAPQEPEGSEA